jgi:hypothetical protein
MSQSRDWQTARRHVAEHILILVLMLASAAGAGTALVTPASALWASGTHSNLREVSGSPRESTYLSVSGSANDWVPWQGAYKTTAWGVTVSWSVSGSSSFDGAWALTNGSQSCPPFEPPGNYLWVGAGPGPGKAPNGQAYVTINTECLIAGGVWWEWQGGLCDSWSQDCPYDFRQGNGPQISWQWSPPGTSAFLFTFRW